MLAPNVVEISTSALTSLLDARSGRCNCKDYRKVKAVNTNESVRCKVIANVKRGRDGADSVVL